MTLCSCPLCVLASTPLLRSHLAQNPFVCDCHLKWLADYLLDNPIETSGVVLEVVGQPLQVAVADERVLGQVPEGWKDNNAAIYTDPPADRH